MSELLPVTTPLVLSQLAKVCLLHVEVALAW